MAQTTNNKIILSSDANDEIEISSNLQSTGINSSSTSILSDNSSDIAAYLDISSFPLPLPLPDNNILSTSILNSSPESLNSDSEPLSTLNEGFINRNNQDVNELGDCSPSVIRPISVDYFTPSLDRLNSKNSTESGKKSSTGSDSSSTTGFYLPLGSPPLPSHITNSNNNNLDPLINKSNQARRSKPEVKSRKRIPSIQGVLGLYNTPSSSSSLGEEEEEDDNYDEDSIRLESPDENGEEEFNEGGSTEEVGRKFSKEEVWYFLRALVGEELRRENSELWKLKSLELDQDITSSVPIFRYLVKNFLLTIPIIRDTTTINSSGVEESTFWSKGIQPLLEGFHTLELSHSMELGLESKGIPASIYSDYLARAVERFVSAGLKLSIGEDETTTQQEFDNSNLRSLVSPAQEETSKGAEALLSSISRATSRDSIIKSDKNPGNKNLATVEKEEEKENRNPESIVSPTTSTKSNRFSLGFFRNKLAPTVPQSPPPLPQTPSIAPLPEEVAPPPTSSSTTSTPALAPDSPTLPKESTPPSTSTNTNRNSNRLSITSISSSEEGSMLFPAGQVSSSWFNWLPDAITGKVTSTSTEIETGEEKVEEIEGDENGLESTKSEPEKITATTNGHDKSDEVDNHPRLSTISSISNYSTSSTSSPPQRRRSSKSPPPLSPPPVIESSSTSPPLLDSSFAASRRVPSVILPNGMNSLRSTLTVPYLDKAGVSWPFNSPISVWRDIEVGDLKWGGFEVDIVGVRSGFFSSPAFLLRIRRPKRLDEYVVRTEAQFVKYFKVLDKEFPLAHVKRIPTTMNQKDDVELSAESTALSSTNSRPRKTSESTLIKKLPIIEETPRSQSRPETPVSITSSGTARSVTPTATTTAPMKTVVPSAFVRQLQAQAQTSLSRNGSVSKKALKNTNDPIVGTGLHRAYSNVGQSKGLSSSEISKQSTRFSSVDLKQAHDSQRRALRNWLRDTLSIKGVGHHEESGEFLLLGSIIPKEIEEMMNRKLIDDARRSARLSVASRSKDKLLSLHTSWVELEKEFIYGNGFTTLSDNLRNIPTIDKLPTRYLKSIDWMQLGFAESIYELFVASEASETNFRKLKSLHEAFPYFLVRQAFKLPVKNMTKVLQDLLITRALGGKSLLQKLISISLDDDPIQLAEKLRISKLKIGSHIMTQKLDEFIYSTEEKKESYRSSATEKDYELVVVIILDKDSTPPLPNDELHRIRQADQAYYHAFSSNLPPSSINISTSPGIQLILELKNYLRLKALERDGALLRSVLGREETGLALEELGKVFMEFVKRVYKVGNASHALGKLEEAIDQFIVVIEALRSRIQEPSKAIRIINNLLCQHQVPVYEFITAVHRSETLVEEFLSWGWTASIFLNRGLYKSINFLKLLPSTNSEAETSRLKREIENIVKYHQSKRMRLFQARCRILAGDVDGDSVVIVRGDGRGRSILNSILEPKLKMPLLREIPKICLEGFKKQIQSIFNV